MQIRRVIARNFRGVRRADWTLPVQRFVCLVGAGDSTKTTLLDVIALVLSPRWSVQFTDADFYRCDLSQAITLQLVIGDLDEKMLADGAFGLELCGMTADGQLLHDPVDGAEPCVMLQLMVDEDLEPEWTVVRPGSAEVGQPISAGKRKALGLFRIDERVDTHLRWGRGSALARLTDASGASRAVTVAGRAAREAVFEAPHPALHAAAEQVATAASAIGGAAYASLRPGWDPLATAATSALVLHEDRIPLTQAGLGTRRLTSIAAQESAAIGGDIVVVDEIEHGLEPHRLLHMLHRIKQRSAGGRGQVIITTHSPAAVQALQAADICVVRNCTGETIVRQAPDTIEEVQGALRACPAAVLARKVIVGEGKTEVGLVRHLVRVWDCEQILAGRPTHAALGVALVDGFGKTAPVRAKIFQELGVTALLLVDNDDCNVDADLAAADDAGVTVVRWQTGHSTEAEIISTLDINGLADLLQLAREIHGDAVRDAVVAKLKNVAPPGSLDPASWLAAGHTLDGVRHSVGEVAKAKGCSNARIGASCSARSCWIDGTISRVSASVNGWRASAASSTTARSNVIPINDDLRAAAGRVCQEMPCSVQLPAGAGKTQVIAALGAVVAEAGKRALVLTHTHAGVDALRRRMRAFGVALSRVRVETIASWSHALVRHYPQLAHFTAPPLPDWADSSRYYAAALRVASSEAIRRVLAASYQLAIVDEYQDCGVDQHALVVALGEVLPVAVFGDPLQSIFRFGGNVPVAWDTDVASRWPNVELPVKPWRWVGHNEALGQWLIHIRTNLTNGTAIALDRAPVTWMPTGPRNRTMACFSQPQNAGSVVAIGNLPYDCAAQARTLRGTYTVMEEIEGKEMMKFAEVIDQGKPEELAAATADYGKTCAANVATSLNSALVKKLRQGKPVTNLKRPGAEDALARLTVLLTDSSPARVYEALVAIGAIPGICIYRHDAWYTMLAALQVAVASGTGVVGAVAQLRNRIRITGRRATQRVVSRPVLIKGLEYDHAVLLDADAHTTTGLYVALTRARRTLTVISREPVLSTPRLHQLD